MGEPKAESDLTAGNSFGAGDPESAARSGVPRIVLQTVLPVHVFQHPDTASHLHDGHDEAVF